MSLKRARDYLKKYCLEDRIEEFSVSSATVKEAAQALNCKEEEIAKTLSFLLEDKVILIVTAGNKKIDNSKYKQEFSKKAKMLASEEVEEKIGHGVGGVCPFGIKANINVYLDISLKEHEYVYPACGSSNSAIKLSIEELEKTSNYAKWIDVCKDI